MLTYERINDPKKLFAGPFYGVVDKLAEGDLAELVTPELESVKKDLRSAATHKLSFFEYNNVIYLLNNSS